MRTDHVAILVRSINAITGTLSDSCVLYELQEQPAEGTLEQYVSLGDGEYPSILLMQAIAEGPYKRALEKRGTGLHHLGCTCRSIQEEISSGSLRNQFLHPFSLESQKYGTVWFCRPGLPFLVELCEIQEQDTSPHGNSILHLPSTITIPDYACNLLPDLSVKIGEGSEIIIDTGELRVKVNPDMD